MGKSNEKSFIQHDSKSNFESHLKIGKCLRFLLFVFIPALILGGCANMSEKAGLLTAAHLAKNPIPVLSVDTPDLDVETAYRIQKAYVEQRLKNDRIAGFKAGLTSEATMEKFGVDSPATGVLFLSGRLLGHSTVKASDFRKLMIEAEIGYIVGERIDKPVGDFEKLSAKIEAIVPVIELPDLGFVDMKRLKGVDISAANVAAAKFIVGANHPMNADMLNEIRVLLRRNGETLIEGKGSDVMGDQKKAIVWLVDSIVGQGYEIEPGQILITGAMGKMEAGKKGVYYTDFGSALGKLYFIVE